MNKNSVANFEGLLQEKKRAFEAVLYNIFSNQAGLEARVYEAMSYSLEAGGKRLRPLLFLEAYEQVSGQEGPVAMDFACALEMIHTYSLVHDDLPAMDNDDFRRGKPTNHKVFGEGLAVLAGDALLNSAFELMIQGALKAHSPRAALMAIQDIAKASGVKGMIGGQVVDMLSEGQDLSGEVAQDALAYIHANKTAALLQTSVCAAGKLAMANEEALRALEHYGYHIGMAFQIVDDILDIVGDRAALGKTIGSDEARGKLTYPVVYGIEKSQAMAKDHLEAAMQALNTFEKPSPFLKELLVFLAERSY